MADPATLASIGMGSSGSGSLISMLGAGWKADAASGQYKYQAAVAEMEKKIALQNRDYAFAQGEKEAYRFGLGAAQRSGAIVAHQGASGIAVGKGSGKDVSDSQKMLTTLDNKTIRENAARRAYGHTLEADFASAKADMYRTAAANAESAGAIEGLSSLISGVTNVSDKWLKASQSGIFSSGGTTANQPLSLNYTDYV